MIQYPASSNFGEKMHHIKIKVRGYHLDMYQHVNNARYLEFLEEARWNFIEAKINLKEWMKKGLGFVVVNININYRKPGSLDQVLEIRSRISKLNIRSATIEQKIFLDGTDTLIADANVTFVIVDTNTGKPVSLKGELLETIKTF
jgi:thioesterase-3